VNALKFCLKHANCMPVYREIISPKLSKLTDFGGSLRLHQVQSVCAKFHTDRCIIPHVLTSCKTYCCIVFLCLKACLIDRICLRLLFSHGAVCWSWCRRSLGTLRPFSHRLAGRGIPSNDVIRYALRCTQWRTVGAFLSINRWDITPHPLDSSASAGTGRDGLCPEYRHIDTHFIHRESKKGATLTMAITLSIFGRFAKFFYCCKDH